MHFTASHNAHMACALVQNKIISAKDLFFKGEHLKKMLILSNAWSEE